MSDRLWVELSRDSDGHDQGYTANARSCGACHGVRDFLSLADLIFACILSLCGYSCVRMRVCACTRTYITAFGMHV